MTVCGNSHIIKKNHQLSHQSQLNSNPYLTAKTEFKPIIKDVSCQCSYSEKMTAVLKNNERI